MDDAGMPKKQAALTQFRFAIGLYVLWTSVLVGLVLTSSDKPPQQPASTARP